MVSTRERYGIAADKKRNRQYTYRRVLVSPVGQ